MSGMSKRVVVAGAAVAAVAAGAGVYALSSGTGEGRKASIGSSTPNVQFAFKKDATTTQYINYDLGPSTVVALKWNPDTTGPDAAEVLETKASSTALVSKLATGKAAVTTTTAPSVLTKVTVDPGQKFQTIDGFGGAMTDSSASMINTLTDAKKDELMKDLFGTTGARFSLTRVPLGASDYVKPTFTKTEWNKVTNDEANATYYNYQQTATSEIALTSHDTGGIIPLLKSAKVLNPALKTMAAPWSAPGWMKTGDKAMWGDCDPETTVPGDGHLATDKYDAYAKYLAQAVKLYGDNGVAINVLGLQNEPENCQWAFPTMRMNSSEQAKLGPKVRAELNSRSLSSVKLLAWDHNYGSKDRYGKWVAPTSFPQEAMGCGTGTGTSTSTFDAVGYHNYDGTDHIEEVHNKLRADCGDKDIYVTEMSGTAGNPLKTVDFRSHLWWRLHHQLFRPLRSWAKGSLYWNIALDANYGPRPAWVCSSNCTAMVTVNADGTYTKNEEYYYYAQFSKFIQPGATRIYSDEPKLPVPNRTAYPVETVAFKNLDGSIVVIAMCQNYA